MKLILSFFSSLSRRSTSTFSRYRTAPTPRLDQFTLAWKVAHKSIFGPVSIAPILKIWLSKLAATRVLLSMKQWPTQWSSAGRSIRLWLRIPNSYQYISRARASRLSPFILILLLIVRISYPKCMKFFQDRPHRTRPLASTSTRIKALPPKLGTWMMLWSK